MENPDAAQVEDAAPPDGFQGIAERGLFPFLFRVRGVQDDCRAGAKQADGNALPAVSFFEPVGAARPDDAVDPARQDRRGLAPPVGMDDDDAVGRAEFVAMRLDGRRNLAALGDFRAAEQGIEALGVEVVEDHVVAGRAQVVPHRLRQGMVQAAGVRVAEKDQDIHGFSLAGCLEARAPAAPGRRRNRRR